MDTDDIFAKHQKELDDLTISQFEEFNQIRSSRQSEIDKYGNVFHVKYRFDKEEADMRERHAKDFELLNFRQTDELYGEKKPSQSEKTINSFTELETSQVSDRHDFMAKYFQGLSDISVDKNISKEQEQKYIQDNLEKYKLLATKQAMDLLNHRDNPHFQKVMNDAHELREKSKQNQEISKQKERDINPIDKAQEQYMKMLRNRQIQNDIGQSM